MEIWGDSGSVVFCKVRWPLIAENISSERAVFVRMSHSKLLDFPLLTAVNASSSKVYRSTICGCWDWKRLRAMSLRRILFLTPGNNTSLKQKMRHLFEKHLVLKTNFTESFKTAVHWTSPVTRKGSVSLVSFEWLTKPHWKGSVVTNLSLLVDDMYSTQTIRLSEPGKEVFSLNTSDISVNTLGGARNTSSQTIRQAMIELVTAGEKRHTTKHSHKLLIFLKVYRYNHLLTALSLLI